MLRFVTALFLLSPAMAVAQCVTSETLDSGIKVEYGNGNVSHIQRQPDGTILDAYRDTDSYYNKIIFFASVDGVIENRFTIFEEGSWAVRTLTNKAYDFSPESQPDYAADARVVSTNTWSENRYYSGSKTYSWIGYESAPLVLGDCSYEAVRVFTYEFNIAEESFFVREVKYLPALGVGIQLGNSYFNWSADGAVIVGISAS